MDKFEDKDLFAPVNNRDIRQDHPELNKIEEFSKEKLTSKEMSFVYYYCAFFANLEGREKITSALYHSFGKDMPDKDRVSYTNGNFPNNVRYAIARWSSFVLPSRIKAKLTVEKMFENIQNMVDVDTKADFVDEKGEINFTKKKAYVDTCSTIIDILPKLIKMEEDGFGVKETTTAREERKAGNSILSQYHKNQEIIKNNV